MGEHADASRPDELRRLEEALVELRQELEISHRQQAYLQAQIFALTESGFGHQKFGKETGSFARGALINLIKRNSFSYKLATRINRFIHR